MKIPKNKMKDIDTDKIAKRNASWYGWTSPEAIHTVLDNGNIVYYVFWNQDLDHIMLTEQDLRHLSDVINKYRDERWEDEKKRT